MTTNTNPFDEPESLAGEARSIGTNESARLIHASPRHTPDDDSTPVRTNRTNRVQAGRLPETHGPAIGEPTKANPLGKRFSGSLEN